MSGGKLNLLSLRFRFKNSLQLPYFIGSCMVYMKIALVEINQLI